ncbi:hypothetical protein ACFPME_03065 [Rhodanobacter umsongensis]|uniref:Uncharacterized protein n=2 Tax=Rhodanobacter umsongensis TaxID=633153 RepID=A0ABW0JHZ6_9GAMM
MPEAAGAPAVVGVLDGMGSPGAGAGAGIGAAEELDSAGAAGIGGGVDCPDSAGVGAGIGSADEAGSAGAVGVGVAGGIGVDVAGAGGMSCAISAPVNISAPVASAVNNGLRDFIINSPCQNTSVSSCGWIDSGAAFVAGGPTRDYATKGFVNAGSLS